MKPQVRLIAPAQGSAAPAVLLVYGDIGEVFGEAGVSSKAIVQQLLALKAPELLVRINSYGGRIDEGLAIYSALREYRGQVTTRIDGVAASIASVIAMAGQRVEIARGAMLMIHSAWQLAEGTPGDLRSAADGLDRANATMAGIYAARSGRTADEELARMTAGGDRWYSAEEAVAEGYATAIFDPAPAEQAAAEPIFAAGLTHHLPAAGAYAAALSARLAPRTAPPAANAATLIPEKRMNWKTIAQLLGIQIPDNANDQAIRDAIAQALNVDPSTDDATLVNAALESFATEEGNEPGEPGGKGEGGQAKGKPAQARAAHPFLARTAQINQLFDVAIAHRQDKDRINAMRAEAILGDKTIDVVRAELAKTLATPTQPIDATVRVGTEHVEQRRAAAVNWLMARAGQVKPGSDAQKALNGNPYRGMSLHDLARDCVEEAGLYRRGMNRMEVIHAAITHSTSDFPNIFENALNKLLLRGFELQKPTWDRFCKTGTLVDFRPHIRYRAGSLGDLEIVQQNGEYKSLTLSDAERETITALSRGGILNVSREMIVNDDMGVFTDVAMMLGTSAARTLDKGVYALFALNSGNGPTMGDGNPLFHASHNNIAGTGGAPTVTTVEAMRVQMGQQLDVSGNDYLDLRLDRWLGPMSIVGQAKVVNNSTYDPDTNNKLQRANIVASLFNDIIDSPRLDAISTAAWYGLADPNVEPVFEVGFLDGQQAPQFAQEEAFNQHGMKWRIVHEWGAAAIGWRGIVKNAGS